MLDETDSGLDIDALKIVADGVNRLRSPERAFVVITHYQRLLDYIVPDVVHVLSRGRIVKTGGKELALELEAKGYAAVSGRGGADASMNAEVRQSMKTDGRAGRSPTPMCRRKRASAAGRGAVAGAARGRVPALRGARACRIAASRSGNTPTCAR